MWMFFSESQQLFAPPQRFELVLSLIGSGVKVKRASPLLRQSGGVDGVKEASTDT